MRKIKKSVKIIISLVCVLAVAIVGIVTAILVTNARKNKGDNPPSVPAYALTDSQKKLGDEISDYVSTSVTSGKLQPVEFSSALSSLVDVSDISYLDKSVAVTKTGQYSYSAYVLDAEGTPSDLLDVIDSKGFVRSGYTNATINFANNGHFSIFYTYSDVDAIRIVCSVENGEVVLNKLFELNKQGGSWYLGNDLFKFAFDKNYFVVMLREGTEYKYKFFEYLSDYSDYDGFE